MVKRRKINYLNNRDLMIEIHKSKCSYSEFIDHIDSDYSPEYSDYDVIVNDFDEIDEEVIEAGKKLKSTRLQHAAFQRELKAKPYTTKKVGDFKIDMNQYTKYDLVYRVMTFDHIPEDLKRKKTKKTVADHHVKLNFLPFKHYIVDPETDEYVQVGQSHTKNGEFSLTHGSLTPKLANMFVLLVHRYSQRSNWRNYTYLDEMKGQSLLQLSMVGLQFNEAKSSNPFAYTTQIISNSFIRVLNNEKKSQNIIDDLLIDAGHNPSFSRQIDHELNIQKLREDTEKDAIAEEEAAKLKVK